MSGNNPTFVAASVHSTRGEACAQCGCVRRGAARAWMCACVRARVLHTYTRVWQGVQCKRRLGSLSGNNYSQYRCLLFSLFFSIFRAVGQWYVSQGRTFEDTGMRPLSFSLARSFLNLSSAVLSLKRARREKGTQQRDRGMPVRITFSHWYWYVRHTGDALACSAHGRRYRALMCRVRGSHTSARRKCTDKIGRKGNHPIT